MLVNIPEFLPINEIPTPTLRRLAVQWSVNPPYRKVARHLAVLPHVFRRAVGDLKADEALEVVESGARWCYLMRQSREMRRFIRHYGAPPLAIDHHATQFDLALRAPVRGAPARKRTPIFEGDPAARLAGRRAAEIRRAFFDLFETRRCRVSFVDHLSRVGLRCNDEPALLGRCVQHYELNAMGPCPIPRVVGDRIVLGAVGVGDEGCRDSYDAIWVRPSWCRATQGWIPVVVSGMVALRRDGSLHFPDQTKPRRG